LEWDTHGKELIEDCVGSGKEEGGREEGRTRFDVKIREGQKQGTSASVVTGSQ